MPTLKINDSSKVLSTQQIQEATFDGKPVYFKRMQSSAEPTSAINTKTITLRAMNEVVMAYLAKKLYDATNSSLVADDRFKAVFASYTRHQTPYGLITPTIDFLSAQDGSEIPATSKKGFGFGLAMRTCFQDPDGANNHGTSRQLDKDDHHLAFLDWGLSNYNLLQETSAFLSEEETRVATPDRIDEEPKALLGKLIGIGVGNDETQLALTNNQSRHLLQRVKIEKSFRSDKVTKTWLNDSEAEERDNLVRRILIEAVHTYRAYCELALDPSFKETCMKELAEQSLSTAEATACELLLENQVQQAKKIKTQLNALAVAGDDFAETAGLILNDEEKGLKFNPEIAAEINLLVASKFKVEIGHTEDARRARALSSLSAVPSPRPGSGMGYSPSLFAQPSPVSQLVDTPPLTLASQEEATNATRSPA